MGKKIKKRKFWNISVGLQLFVLRKSRSEILLKDSRNYKWCTDEIDRTVSNHLVIIKLPKGQCLTIYEYTSGHDLIINFKILRVSSLAISWLFFLFVIRDSCRWQRDHRRGSWTTTTTTTTIWEIWLLFLGTWPTCRSSYRRHCENANNCFVNLFQHAAAAAAARAYLILIPMKLITVKR